MDGYCIYLFRWLGVFRRFMVMVSYRTILHKQCSSHRDMVSRDWSAW
jgi:hypothetical protein